MRSITSGGPIICTNFLFKHLFRSYEVLSPKKRCEAYPVGVQLFLLMFYFGLGNVLWKKKGHPSTLILKFWNRENVLSPEGICVAYPMGSNCSYICFNCWCRKDTWQFQNHTTAVTFFFFENVLFTDGWMDGWDGVHGTEYQKNL